MTSPKEQSKKNLMSALIYEHLAEEKLLRRLGIKWRSVYKSSAESIYYLDKAL